ncbi:hypothetical protein [Oceanobacillus manasiensis]|uniref:hypothetical protein n=1 Tax=Oceanobacillus manasiensis TaxID=586413 RepID=UPI0012EBC5D8|nr:hypothetical protein [Oceanobacillus manasiensis]
MSTIKKLFVIIGILLIVTACTDAKITVPIEKYEEVSQEKEIVEETGEETGKEELVPQNANEKIDISIHSKSDVVTPSNIGFCWNESVEEDCALHPENPKGDISSEDPLLVNKEEELEIYMYVERDKLLVSAQPYKVEVLQFGLRVEEGKIVDSKTDRDLIKFSAPDEKGAHFYLIHVIWDEEETKRAYYAFRAVVS